MFDLRCVNKHLEDISVLASVAWDRERMCSQLHGDIYFMIRALGMAILPAIGYSSYLTCYPVFNSESM